MMQGHEQERQKTTQEPSTSTIVNIAAPPPATTRPREEAPPAGAAPARSVKDHIVTAALALIFGAIGSYAFLHFVEPPPRSPGSTGETASEGPEAAGPSTRDLGDQVSRLADRVEHVQKRVDELPRPEPPPDLSDLQVQVADLTKATQAIAPLRGELKHVEDRLDDLTESIHTLESEVRAGGSRTGTVKTTSTGGERAEHNRRSDGVSVAETTSARPLADRAFEPGAALLNQHKYKEALDYFSKLEQTNPDDARVWYYAALAHGFATKQWTEDGTGRLVEKGIECERAGTPSRDVIDATFSTLTSETGKDWLAAYRKRVDTR